MLPFALARRIMLRLNAATHFCRTKPILFRMINDCKRLPNGAKPDVRMKNGHLRGFGRAPSKQGTVNRGIVADW
jgi:hypothetical protein